MNAPRKPRWRKWLVRAIVAVLAGRLLLAIALPWLVDLAAHAAGLTASYRSASLSLLGLSLRFEDLRVGDAANDAAAPLLTAHELTADVSTLDLLRGDLVVVDVALAGGRLELARAADGALQLPAAWRGSATTPAAPTPPPAAPAPLRFDLPCRIESARVHDLRVHVAADAPRQALDCVLDLDVAEVGDPTAPGRVTLRLHSPGGLDHLTLQATTLTTERQLDVQWQVTARGVRPAALPLGDAVVQQLRGVRTLGLDLRGRLHGTAGAGDADPAMLDGNLDTALMLDDAERLRCTLTLGPAPATAGTLHLPFACQLHIDECVDDLRLEAGRLDATAAQTTLMADLTGRGITLHNLEPWLKAAGVGLLDGGHTLAARLRATVQHGEQGPAYSAQLEQVNLQHGDEKVEFAVVSLADLRVGSGECTVGAVTIDGPSLSLLKTPDGALVVAGLRFTAPLAAPPTAPVAAPAGSLALPNLLLQRVEWRLARLDFVDASLPEPATVGLRDFALRGEALALGRSRPPGHLVATCSVPGACTAARIELRVQAQTTTAEANLDLTCRGLTLTAVAPWLARRGLVPILRDGQLQVAATARLAIDQGNLGIDADLTTLRLQDGDELLAGMQGLTWRGLRLGPAGTDLGTLDVEAPTLVVQRNADSTLDLVGLQLRPVAAAAPTAPTAAPATRPGAAAVAPARGGAVVVRGAKVQWRRQAGTELQQIALAAEASIGPAAGTGTERPFACTVTSEGLVDSLSVRGGIVTTAAGLDVAAELDTRGVRGAGLTALLPPELASTLRDGAVRGRLRASVGASPASLDLALDGLRLLDGDAELAAVDQIQLKVPSMSADAVHVADLQLHGVRATAAATADGLQVAGLLLRTTPSGQAAAARPAAASAAAPTSVVVPAVQLDALDLQFDRLTFHDQRQPGAEPVVASLRVQLVEPWVQVQDLALGPPAKLRLTAAAPPLCREVELTAELHPYHIAPMFQLDVRATGIDTTALAKVSPPLADRIQGLCTDAQLRGKVTGRINLRRRSPRQFDFGRAFGADLLVEELTLEQAPGGEVLAAVPVLELAARSIDLRSGDVRLRSLEVDGPHLHVRRTAAGLEVAGLRLADAAAAPAAEDRGPDAAEPPEFAIDQFDLTGLAVDYRDTTTSPHTHLPLQDVDLSVQHFTTRAFVEPRTFSFTLGMRGGDVDLEKRIVRSSVVSGLLGSAANAVTFGRNEHAREQRPLLDEFAIEGHLQLVPLPKGHLEVRLGTFELPALRGLAANGGIDLNDGVLDVAMTADMRGQDGIFVKSRPVFTWLSVTEPPGGPISTYLRLPAPLDTVLFLLRNSSDEHHLPLQLHLPAAGLSPGSVRDAFVEALVKLIASAVASSPLRAAGTLTGLFGVGGRPADLGHLTTALPFQPGETTPAPVGLDALLAALAADDSLGIELQSELSPADLGRVAQLANPPAPVVKETVRRLLHRREVLVRQRDALAPEVAARFAAGPMQAAVELHAQLATLDAQLGAIEGTLEDALEILTTGAPRAAARRTHAAARELGATRLRAVQALLADRLPGGGIDRITLRNPRGIPLEGLADGGRVVVTVRRRAGD